MKLQCEINGEHQEIEIRQAGREVSAIIGGREYLVDVSEPESGVFLLKHENAVYQASVSGNSPDYGVQLRGKEFHAKIIDPKKLRGTGSASDDESGRAEIRTAMPGKVVRTLKSVGDTVEKGDGVIVVEAMKMQNEMKSPKEGTVTEIKFGEGDTVGAGDVLVVIE